MTVVRFKADRLDDEQHLRLLFQQVAGLTEAGWAKLVLTLGGVAFLASAAIAKLLMLDDKVRAAHGRLALCQVSRTTEEALEVMRLKDLVQTYGSEDEAVQSF